MTNPVLANFASQADACRSLGSPFTAELCLLLADTIDRGSAFGARLLDWPDTARDDAVALRACGALHALARSGLEPDLTAHYPPNPFDTEGLRAAIRGAIGRHDEFLTKYLDSPPQTNEVARSAIVLGGLQLIARETGQPLELLEIGSSAGLNLMLDDYRYDLGDGRQWGANEAPLTIACAWTGKLPPLDAPLEIAARAGCDRNPLDARSQATVERLLSYVWADQTARMERLSAALNHMAQSNLRVEKADAADWLEQRLSKPQQPGVTRVLFHTIVWQYLPEAVKQRAKAAIAKAASVATENAPFAHLAFEADGQAPGGGVRLTLWPGGEERLLARADYHGRWVEWQ